MSASIAQWLEHCSRKAGVVSSILTGGLHVNCIFEMTDQILNITTVIQ